MTTVLITGVNAGIGRGLLTTYLSRPNHTVIGSIRDATSPVAKELNSLPTADGTKLILLSIENTVPTSAADAINSLSSKGIDKIDVIIANAGGAFSHHFVADVPFEEVLSHADVNVGGPIRLLQAALPLLKKSSAPKFAVISSAAGSITSQAIFPLPNASYGAAKAMLNFLAYKLHTEQKDLTVIILHPGLVKTDTAVKIVSELGFSFDIVTSLTVDESVSQLTKRIDSATRESSGVFLNYDGTPIPW